MSITINEYKEKMESIKGMTIAIVYVFEGDTTAGYAHYDAWKADVISSWLLACQELSCLPLVMDLRTFIHKAMDNTLPHIDFVVNLNNGTYSLSTLGLLPSVCSYLGLPCIPCDAFQIIAGEEKRVANLVANKCGIQLPREIAPSTPGGIYRPLGLGSSRGVTRNNKNADCVRGLYQEFIPGFDMTTPIMYNPLTGNLETLSPVLYLPDSKNTSWFLGETEKDNHAGYTKTVVNLTEEAKEHYLLMCKWYGIRTFCRIDARVYCEDYSDLSDMIDSPIPTNRIRFLEINPMPTVKEGINFHTALKLTDKNQPLGQCIDMYFTETSNATYTGFILSSAMLSLRAKY